MPLTLGRRGFLPAAAIASAAMPALARPSGPAITVSVARGLNFGDFHAPCAVGWGGIRASKREGDGATPSGLFPLRRVLFRADRVSFLMTSLPSAPIGARDGWCAEPDDPLYNQQVELPRSGRSENLWRRDGLYDVIVVLGYNDAPVVPGRGSAIFLHVARPALSPTDGCVAIPRAMILDLIKRCDPGTEIEISA